MNDTIKNTGFIATPITNTDFISGILSGITYKEVCDGDWTKYLPENEYQNNGALETSACVTFGATNSIEMQLNRLLLEDLIPDKILQEFKDLGYLDDGLFNFSDRFTARLSNTTPAGNTLPNVWSAIRHYGLLPEADWPSVWTAWAVYYQGIPQSLKDKALKFLQYFDVQYEYIVGGAGSLDLNTAKYHLKQAPIEIATAVCSGWNSAPVVQTCNQPVAHATCLYKADSVYYDMDSYAPYQKKLAGDYKIPYAFKGLITPKFTLKNKNNDMKVNLLRKKNTQEVFLEIPSIERYWIKEAQDFEQLKSVGLIGDWSTIQEVDAFFTPYNGKIIGSANFSDILRIVFGSVK